MYQALVLMSLFGPIFVTGQFTCSDQDWLLFGTSCYKIGDTLDYLAATTACSNLGGFIIMPKTTEEMDSAISLQNSLPMNSDGTIPQVWIGFNKINTNENWKWADGSELNKLSVTDSSIGDDCVRLRPDTQVRDTSCNSQYVTVCQRAASLETSSFMDISSSPEVTTENPKTVEVSTTTNTDLSGTTVADLSTTTQTTVESSTSNSASSVSHSPTVSSTPSSVMSTNSTQYCTYVSTCSNQTNNTPGSQEYTYKVDKKKLSSYKRKHQSASDPRKSSMYIGSVGIAVLVSIVLLIVFLDCVSTKV